MKKIIGAVVAAGLLFGCVCLGCMFFFKDYIPEKLIPDSLIEQNPSTDKEDENELSNLQLVDCEFELKYHVSGDDDILDLLPKLEGEDSKITEAIVSYLKKMEQGGRIVGEGADGVYHLNLFAEDEEDASIEAYYDGNVVFNTKTTMDYVLTLLSGDSNVAISMIRTIMPNGYISLKQLMKIASMDEGEIETTINIEEIQTSLKETIKFAMPTKVKPEYFEDEMKDLDMSYYVVYLKLGGEAKTKAYVGMQNEEDESYFYIQANDVNGKEGSKLELLGRIEPMENKTVEMPETISDKTIDKLMSLISFISNL